MLAFVVTVVARPLAVFIATPRMGFAIAERIVLGWAGLRGAVPVVLATFPVIASVTDSGDFFNIAFFAVLISTVVQGTTFEALARRLKVTTSESALPDSAARRRRSATARGRGDRVPGAEGHAIVGRRVRETGLPRDALLNVIIRGDQAILPRGSTEILAGDRLHLLVRQEAAVELRTLMERWQTGPIGQPARERPVTRTSPRPFSVRPWNPADGDAGRAHGDRGRRRLRPAAHPPRRPAGRAGPPQDGSYAFTGSVVGIGNRTSALEGARRQLRLAAERRRARLVAQRHRRSRRSLANQVRSDPDSGPGPTELASAGTDPARLTPPPYLPTGCGRGSRIRAQPI